MVREHRCHFSEDEIEDNLTSRRSLALYRISLLQEEECSGQDNDASTASGFPSLFLPLLSTAIGAFVSILSRNQLVNGDNCQNCLLSELNETIHLTRLLRIYRRISKLDPVLDEEIGKQGAHLSLSRLIKLDIYSIDCCQCGDETTNEANQDTIIEIQDLACEIAAFSKTFPVQASPFMREDLRARLPLVFTIRPVIGSENCGSRYGKDGVTILINQVTDRQSAQKDVGFVMWPSAVVLSRWLVSNPSELHGKNVLELGAGCGLTGLVAAKILQDFKNEIDNKLPPSETTTTASPDSGGVVLSDFNETVLKNLSGNIGLNDLNKIAIAEGLDFYQQDPNGNGRRTIDGIRHTDLSELILAADVICQPEDAFAAARTIASALKEGCKAIVVSADSKHRFGVEKLEEACNVVGCLSVVSKSNVDNYLYDDSSSRDSDDSSVTARDEDMEKTSGFVHGMTLTMYTIVKNSTVVQ